MQLKSSQPAGFEPARVEPIGFQVQRLNHSATTAHVYSPLFFLYTLYYEDKYIDSSSFFSCRYLEYERISGYTWAIHDVEFEIQFI